MRDMTVNVSGGIEEFTELLRRWRRINLVYSISGLTRGQVV
jgi:hypothetical protein